MPTVFRAGDMGLRDFQFLRNGSLRQLSPTAHNRQLGGQRKFGKSLRVLKRSFRMRLKQFMQVFIKASH